MEYLEDYEDDRTEEIIRYTWNTARYVSQNEKVNEQCGRRNEVQVQIDNDTFQYGHEYVGLNPIFQVFSLILVWSASSFYPAVCDWWQSCAGIQDGSQVGFRVQKFQKLFARYNLIIDTSEMHTLNKLSRVFGTNVKTILCNNPNMTLKIQVKRRNCR